MNIQEFKEKFPQYKGWSDKELSHGLHKKFYSDMKYEDFAEQFLVKTKPKKYDEFHEEFAGRFTLEPNPISERIKDIYLKEVEESSQAINRMVEDPSGKTIGTGLLGILRYGFSPLTAVGKGAIKEPISGGLTSLGIPQAPADFLGEMADIGMTGFVPYGKMVKGAIGALETKEALKAGELIAKDAAMVQRLKQGREAARGVAEKPPLKYPSEPTTELAGDLAAAGKLSKPVIEESLQDQVAKAATKILKDNPDEKRRIGQQVIDLIHSDQMNWRELPDILSKHNITPQEFAQRLKDTYSTAGRTLARLSIVAQKVKKTLKDNPEASAYLDEISKIAPEEMLIDKVFRIVYNVESTRRGFLVTQMATFMRNALSQAGRATIGSVDDAFQGAIKATVGGEGNFLKQVGDGLDIFTGFYHRLTPSGRKVVDNILKSDNADIARIKLLSTPVHEVTLGSKAANILNIPNHAQEVFFRKMAFESKLTQLLERAGMNIKNIDPNKIPEGMLGEAANYALEMTFAAMPKSKTMQEFVRSWAGQPLLTAGLNPFPRFAFGNALPFLTNFSPISFIKAFNPKVVAELAMGNPEKFAEYASKATIGSIMLGTAVAYRSSPEAAENYYEYGTGDKRIDLRAYAPLLTPYLLVAEAMIRPEKLEAADWIQAAVGLNRIAGTGLVAIDLIRTKKAEEVQNIFARLAGEYLGSFSVPARTFKDLYTAIDEKEAIGRDTRDKPLTSPFVKNIPYLSQTLPESVSPLKTTPPGMEEPISVGGVEVPVSILRQITGLSVKTVNEMQKEVNRLGISVQSVFPRTGIPEADRAISKNMGPILEKVAPKILNSPKYKELDESIKKGIWEGMLNQRGVLSLIKTEAIQKLQKENPNLWMQIWHKKKSEVTKDILEKGGITKEKIKGLNIPSSQAFKTPEEVKAAFDSGKFGNPQDSESQEKAANILRSQFGFE